MVEVAHFIQAPYRESTEWQEVSSLAAHLLSALNSPDTLAAIERANRPRAPSHAVQDAVRGSAEALGFRSEAAGLFATSIPGLRPDYFTQLGQAGILLEVERGKTTTNNMDLLDFWKCHISGFAQYLFLLVPKALQHNERMAPKKEFASVRRRLAQFFEPGKYTNVRGLCVFGY